VDLGLAGAVGLRDLLGDGFELTGVARGDDDVGGAGLGEASGDRLRTVSSERVRRGMTDLANASSGACPSSAAFTGL
jgi:hypothetical protein